MKKNYALLLLFSLTLTLMGKAQVTLSQTTSDAIVPGSIACTGSGITSDNIYYRAFNLSALGYSQFDVNQVSFAIESITSPSPGFAVEVIIYSNIGGTFPAGTLTPVTTVSVPITLADSNTIKAVPVNATVVAPAQLVFGVSIPDETNGGTTQFFIGSNASGQSDPGYISSVGCGFTNPTTITNIGFPNMHVVMNVTGIALSVDEFSISRVSILPNPASDYITIELHPSNSITAVEIYSITGQLVYKSLNNNRLDISNLENGIYMMRVETTNGISSKKLIKS